MRPRAFTALDPDHPLKKMSKPPFMMSAPSALPVKTPGEVSTTADWVKFVKRTAGPLPSAASKPVLTGWPLHSDQYRTVLSVQQQKPPHV
jgi:hypothetical protein